MFGFGIKSKTIKVLKEKFNYPINSITKDTLETICSEVSDQRLNEYDAAIMFMSVQINILIQNKITKDSDSSKTFIENQVKNIESVMSLAKTPHDELQAFVNGVLSQFEVNPKEKIGNHPFSSADEVPIFDEQGRMLILRSKICPIQVIAPHWFMDGIALSGELLEEALQKKKVNQDLSRDSYENASHILRQFAKGPRSQIQNWEIGYTNKDYMPLENITAAKNSVQSRASMLINYPLWQYRAFMSEETIKPYGLSSELSDQAEEIVDVFLARNSRKRIVEPRHPYKDFSEVPSINEIGYNLILRSSRLPEILFILTPDDLSEGKGAADIFGPDSNQDVKDYEVGYYNPEKYRGGFFLLDALYDENEITVKPFGHSEKLIEDCRDWKSKLDSWYFDDGF